LLKCQGDNSKFKIVNNIKSRVSKVGCGVQARNPSFQEAGAEDREFKVSLDYSEFETGLGYPVSKQNKTKQNKNKSFLTPSAT
jgi:hypothetical protein